MRVTLCGTLDAAARATLAPPALFRSIAAMLTLGLAEALLEERPIAVSATRRTRSNCYHASRCAGLKEAGFADYALPRDGPAGLE